MGAPLCSMSIGRGAYQSGLWLTGKAWVYLDKALVLLSFCPYLESLELQMTQLSSSETQLTKSLSYSRPPFSCLQKCLGLGGPLGLSTAPSRDPPHGGKCSSWDQTISPRRVLLGPPWSSSKSGIVPCFLPTSDRQGTI